MREYYWNPEMNVVIDDVQLDANARVFAKMDPECVEIAKTDPSQAYRHALGRVSDGLRRCDGPTPPPAPAVDTREEIDDVELDRRATKLLWNDPEFVALRQKGEGLTAYTRALDRVTETVRVRQS